jgi:hypothetical protein
MDFAATMPVPLRLGDYSGVRRKCLIYATFRRYILKTA